MNFEKYLPIGSVVLLKGATKKLMITGYCCSPKEEQSKLFDYSGVLYPEGILNSDENAVFNHEDIDKVYYMGYSDDEAKEFLKIVKTFVEAKNKSPEETSNN